MDLSSLIRDIPDFPKKGILFKDITTLLSNKEAFTYTMKIFKDRYKKLKIDKVVGIESRGFILGASLANMLNCGFIPIRKKGKLPFQTFGETYELEYGIDSLEIHTDALNDNENVVLIDDVLATGGTVKSAIKLLNNFKANIIEIAFLIELSNLEGRNKFLQYNLQHYSIIKV